MDHSDTKPVFRKDVVESMKKPRITREFYTKYESVRLLGTRIHQLADGAKPLVSLDGLKTSHPRFLEFVALREIEQRKLPLLINRHLPNGDEELWSTQDLEMMW